MNSKVLLINYGGFSFNTSTFIADNSLELLAQTLLHFDIDTQIFDKQTPSFFKEIGLKIKEYRYTKQVDTILQEGGYNETIFKGHQRLRDAIEDNAYEALNQTLLNKIKAESFTHIGFKLWFGNELKHAISLIKKLKDEMPKKKIMAGGPGVTLLATSALISSLNIDHLITGNAEEKIVQVFYPNLSLGQIKTHLLTRPINQYHPLVYPQAQEMLPVRILDDSRGCFNICAFCSHSTINEIKTEHQIDAILKEITTQQALFNINHFRLAGPNPKREFLLKLCHEIIQRNLKIKLSLFSSVNNLQSKDFEILRRAGVIGVFFGIESGDASFAKKIHNKELISNSYIIELLQAAMKEDIFISTSFIIPSPFEDDELKTKALDLVSKIFRNHPNGAVVMTPPILFYGSKWWNEKEKYGFKFLKDEDSYLRSLALANFGALYSRPAYESLEFSLNNKRMSEMLKECMDFNEKVRELGIRTNVDEFTHLLGDLFNTSAENYKTMMLRFLIGASDFPRPKYKNSPISSEITKLT